MAGNLNPAARIAARQALEATGTDTQLGRFISDNVAVLFAYPLEPANDPRNQALLAQLRSITSPAGLDIFVGGGTAEIVDVVDTIYRDFPFVAAVVVLSTYLILLTLFRSVLLPIKAILMNALSILASYGALVWIFQDGNLSGILGFTPQGFVEASLPVIMFCVLFGLSMDYEVFLLSRIQEEWERTGDNDRAVAVGLQRSGRRHDRARPAGSGDDEDARPLELVGARLAEPDFAGFAAARPLGWSGPVSGVCWGTLFGRFAESANLGARLDSTVFVPALPTESHVLTSAPRESQPPYT